MNHTTRCAKYDRRIFATVLSLINLLTGPITLAAVGAIPGAFSVDSSGAATYSIPITVAEAAGGLRPNIGLIYNSRVADGIAGVGWNLTGFSAIARCGLSIALDGERQGVRFSNEDRFCLDGRPLVMVNGSSYGDHNTEYRMEVHSYQKIVSQFSVGTGPQYFRVQMRDGLTYFYGDSASSRIEAPNTNGEVRVWALNRIVDKFDNAIAFDYYEGTDGEYDPQRVSWGGGSYSLDFVYAVRPDGRNGFVSGSPWAQTRRLTNIRYRFQGSLIHDYRLAYTVPGPNIPGTGRSRLASLTQCAEMDCLPPTTFKWGISWSGWEGLPASQGAANQVLIDYDGDGDVDKISTDDDVINLSLANNGHYSAWQQIGGLPVDTSPCLGCDDFDPVPLDYNGDGLSDLLVVTDEDDRYHVYVSDADNRELWCGRFCVYDTGLSRAETAPLGAAAFDMDGDGLDDLVYVRGSAVKFRKNLGAQFGAEENATLNGGGNYTMVINRDLPQPDFDGDGRKDLLIASVQCSGGSCGTSSPGFTVYYDMYLSTGDNFSTSLYGTTSSFTGPLGLKIQTPDINGDGLSDVVFEGYPGGTWRTMLSDGEGFIASSDTSIGVFNGQFADHNNDGYPDLLESQKVYFSDGETYSPAAFESISFYHCRCFQVGDANGDGSADILSESGVWLHNARYYEGDVMTRITDGLGNYQKPTYGRLSSSDSYTADRRTGILPPVTTSGVSVAGDLPAPPVTRLIFGGSVQVVTATEESATYSGWWPFTTTYEYWNAQIDMRGRGFLGFAQIRSVDDRNNWDATTIYHQDFPYVGRVKFKRTLRDTGGVYEELRNWDTHTSAISEPGGNSAEIHFVRQSSTDDYNFQESEPPMLIRRVENVFTWDNDHGAVSIDEEYVYTDSWNSRANAFFTQRKAIDSATGMAGFDAALMLDQWCLGRAPRTDVTKTFPDARPTTETLTTLTSYDSATCILTEERIGSLSDPHEQLKTTYGFDDQGRATTISINDGADSLSPRVTTIAYPPNSWSPRAASRAFVIDTEIHPRAYGTWNEKLGYLQERTDVQGLTTRWEYDGFGRPTREEQITLGTYTNIAITPCTGWCPADRSQYTITQSRSDGFWSKAHYDSWGRQVGEAHALLGEEARQETYHDRWPGRKLSSSLPFVAGEAEYFVGFTYDSLNRLTEDRRPVDENDSQWPGNAITQWAHELEMVKLRDAENNSTWYRYRPDGEIHQVTETPLTSPAVTNYRYTPFGRLSSIADPDDIGPATTIDYDALGHPKLHVDAETGISTFDYNVFGELIVLQDDLGNMTTTHYDQLGRIESRSEDMDKNGSQETTTWDYVPFGSAGSGQLDIVSGPTPQLSIGGFSKQHTYNSLAQLTGTVTTIDGSVYQTDYTYNPQGQIQSITYPMTIGNRPKFIYHYMNGYLKRIDQDGGTGSVYEVLELDASARVRRSVAGGDFIVSDSTYDRGNARLTGLSTTLNLQNGPADIQDYSYEWDKVGNLVARTDQIEGIAETFVYDGVNRLTEMWLNAQRTQSIAYHPDGRIDTRTGGNGYLGVGSYVYDNGANSNAVTRIAGDRENAYHYDRNGNMVCRGDSTAACESGDRITWYSFNKPNSIEFTDGARTNESRLAYGPDLGLIKQTNTSNVGVRNIEYIDDHFEREVQGNSVRYRSYVFANGRVVYALHESRTSGKCATRYASNPYFIHRDHQGSVDKVTLWDVSGAGAVSTSFDAFGKRRNSDWTPDDSDLQLSTAHLTDHGYTGHAHLDNVRQIYMSGRVQDPIIGRMISADPLIGNIENPQSLNRYSYVMNNPMSLTDPSGFCEAGSEANEGSCPTPRQVSLVRDLVRADNSIKGAGKVIPGFDTAVALGAYASSFGVSGLFVGGIDVTGAFAKSDNLDSTQYSVDDGRGGLVTYIKGDPLLRWRNATSPESSRDLVATRSGNETVAFGGTEAGSDMFLLFLGVSGSSGVVFDNRKLCGFTQSCVQIGFGGYLGITGQGIGGLTRPLDDGSHGTLGVFAVGSAGGGGFGTLDVNSSSLTLGGGFSSGIGGAAGAQFCRMDIFGCN